MRWMWRMLRFHPDELNGGAERAERELAKSEQSLREAQRDVIVPLRRMRERNNVTALVARLTGGDGRGAAAR